MATPPLLPDSVSFVLAKTFNMPLEMTSEFPPSHQNRITESHKTFMLTSKMRCETTRDLVLSSEVAGF